MRLFIKKLCIYGIVFFLFFNCIALFSLFVLGRSSFYKPQFVKNTIKENSFDYVVLGSSTGLTTLDTKLIDSITNKSGLNISMDDSALNSQYLMLQYFYKLNKKTKKLVLAVTPWDLKNANPKLNNNDYRFLTFVNDDFVYDYYKNFEKGFFKPLTFSKFCPIIGVSYYNTEIFFPSIIALVKPKFRNKFDDKGNFSYPKTGKPLKLNKDTYELIIKNPYYFKIKKFCNDNNIELITYISPIFKTKVFTKEIDIINHSNIIDDEKLFYDDIHVNKNGRKLCSELFSSYIK